MWGLKEKLGDIERARYVCNEGLLCYSLNRVYLISFFFLTRWYACPWSCLKKCYENEPSQCSNTCITNSLHRSKRYVCLTVYFNEVCRLCVLANSSPVRDVSYVWLPNLIGRSVAKSRFGKRKLFVLGVIDLLAGSRRYNDDCSR